LTRSAAKEGEFKAVSSSAAMFSMTAGTLLSSLAVMFVSKVMRMEELVCTVCNSMDCTSLLDLETTTASSQASSNMRMISTSPTETFDMAFATSSLKASWAGASMSATQSP
jgi:hypothetical protein